jgi:hypothetical protein
MGRKADTADIRPGDLWQDSIGVVRVMAVAEGYVMYRRRGCMPLVDHHVMFRKVHRLCDSDVPHEGGV